MCDSKSNVKAFAQSDTEIGTFKRHHLFYKGKEKSLMSTVFVWSKNIFYDFFLHIIKTFNSEFKKKSRNNWILKKKKHCYI